MHRFDTENWKDYSELPLDTYNTMKVLVAVVSKEWNYLFLNDYNREINSRIVNGLLGRNIWAAFPELLLDTNYIKLKANCEQGININVVLTSPVIGQRLNVRCIVLNDCYVFFSTILPDKAELLNELLNELRKEISKSK
jgi:hypothetical protein